MNEIKTFIFDTEVFAYDFIAIFKDIETGEFFVYHNDGDAIGEFMKEHSDALFGGFNSKHYDRFVLAAMINTGDPMIVKDVNDFIIAGGNEGWNYPDRDVISLYFNQFDLMDDCQAGLSLKAIEAHLGMNIEESEVDFNIDRPLTDEELEETIFYCKYDVTATETLYHKREDYLNNKITLGRAKNLSDSQAVYMTNAKLTAVYLDAQPKEHDDEREYKYPENLLREYIPQDVFDFFDRIHDSEVSDEELFTGKLNFNIGDCEVTLGFGGIHGAIPTYREKSTEDRTIRNQDVASYYPHLMTLDGYCSRSIPNPTIYEEMLETRMRAKKSGDKATANALKLVANTTYGAMLSRFNDLYDPLMGRSVCITGQLRLLELTNHLVTECSTLKVIQLNTDGIMVSLDNSDIPKYQEIVQEWQDRTGFELEEDVISEIIQKDVNNYVEIATDGSHKIKGGQLVRGIAPAGAFNVNNNMPVVAKAIVNYLADGIPVEKTINEDDTVLDFQLVAKASSKYSAAWHIVNGEKVAVQKCNRVYASKDKKNGTLYKTHKEKGNDVKQSGLPTHCIIDNDNELSIDAIDKKWYITQAKKIVNDFLGIQPPKKNTRKINSLKKDILKLLEE